MTVSPYYKSSYSGYDTPASEEEKRALEWTLKRIDSLSYYKKEKVILNGGEKNRVKMEFRNRDGRIVRAGTLFICETDEVYGLLLDALAEAEKLRLGDVEWKIRYQRPNAFYQREKQGSGSSWSSHRSDRW